MEVDVEVAGDGGLEFGNPVALGERRRLLLRADHVEVVREQTQRLLARAALP